MGRYATYGQHHIDRTATTTNCSPYCNDYVGDQHLPEVPAKRSFMEDSRWLIGQRHGVNTVDKWLEHLFWIALELGKQRFQPANVRLGVSVHEEEDWRAGSPSAVHARYHQALPCLVPQ